MANVKVRVGQHIQDGQVIAYESSSGLWKNTSQLNINIDGGVY
jgi:hypothetical protein